MPGNTVPAVFAIPAANRPGFTGYFIPTPPSSYRNQAWMSYSGENELPSQWADSVRALLDTLQGGRDERRRRCVALSQPACHQPGGGHQPSEGGRVRGQARWVVLWLFWGPARFYLSEQGNLQLINVYNNYHLGDVFYALDAMSVILFI